jgi:hypothetical protein
MNLISHLTDADMLHMAVNESAKVIPYVVGSRKAVKDYLKVGTKPGVCDCAGTYRLTGIDVLEPLVNIRGQGPHRSLFGDEAAGLCVRRSHRGPCHEGANLC